MLPWFCDRNMGIYQKVIVEATDEVLIENPFVITTLPKSTTMPMKVDTGLAKVNIKLEVRNTSAKACRGKGECLITLLNEVKFPTYTKHMEGYLKPIKLTKRSSPACR